MTDAELQAKRDKALELHLAGATYEAIAQAVGYASKSSAHDAVQEALKARAASPSAADAVQLEVARLDAMLTGLWAKARRGDVAAVDRALRIGERRTALLLMASSAAAGAEPAADSVGSAQDAIEAKLRLVQ